MEDGVTSKCIAKRRGMFTNKLDDWLATQHFFRSMFLTEKFTSEFFSLLFLEKLFSVNFAFNDGILWRGSTVLIVSLGWSNSLLFFVIIVFSGNIIWKNYFFRVFCELWKFWYCYFFFFFEGKKFSDININNDEQ